MNPLLRQLAEHMAADIESAFDAQEQDMLAAIQKLRDGQSGDDEKPLVFSVSLGGKLNLDKSIIETAFSYAVKTTVKDKHPIDDPGQVAMPFAGLKKFGNVSVRINDGPEVKL